MNTTNLIANLPNLPLYRTRVTSDSPGYLLTNFGRSLFSARVDADRVNAIGGGLCAVVESFDRHSGVTIRILA